MRPNSWCPDGPGLKNQQSSFHTNLFVAANTTSCNTKKMKVECDIVADVVMGKVNGMGFIKLLMMGGEW